MLTFLGRWRKSTKIGVTSVERVQTECGQRRGTWAGLAEGATSRRSRKCTGGFRFANQPYVLTFERIKRRPHPQPLPTRGGADRRRGSFFDLKSSC
jgi:hypothetical protein